MEFGTTIYDKVCQWLAADRWFSSSTNKTGRHDIAKIFCWKQSGVKHHYPNPWYKRSSSNQPVDKSKEGYPRTI